jgi:hypothetical protein
MKPGGEEAGGEEARGRRSSLRGEETVLPRLLASNPNTGISAGTGIGSYYRGQSSIFR